MSDPPRIALLLIAAVLAAMAVLALVHPASHGRLGRVAGRPPSASSITALRGVAVRTVAMIGVGPASRRRRSAARVQVMQSLGALAAELEAGQPPTTALMRSAGSPPAWPNASAAAELGGDVAAALVLDAQRHPVLRQLAACWQVASQTGTGLAEAVTHMTDAARTAEDVRADLEAQLAAPRATARLLAVLPVVGLGFGVMLGADPLGWLTGSRWGQGCLVGGVALTAVGLWWTGRIAAAVERRL